jgi:D-3-phosphoglycerate dehydrogenase
MPRTTFLSKFHVLQTEAFRAFDAVCRELRDVGLMKRGAIFINCGRGPLVDEAALIAALQSGQLGGAGLDVTAQEPCPPLSPLFAMPNVLLTPHYAPTTTEAAVAVSRMAAQNVIDILNDMPVEGRLI